MARARNIKPSFFTNDKLSEISCMGRLLFIGLWTIADREGRLEDRPKKIKAEVLPYDECDADGLLNDLEQHGFILRYEAGESKYIQILTFKKHQNPHVKEAVSTIPAPGKHQTSTVKCTTVTGTSPADSLLPITDSLLPITPPSPIGDVPPEKACTFPVWLERIKSEKQKPISSYKPVWNYARTVGISDDWIHIAWLKFLDRYTTDEKASRKRYKDWRGVFLRAIKDNWFNIWYAKDGNFILTTTGYQADIETREPA